MDPEKLKEAYERLDLLDDRLTHKVRPRAGAIHRPTQDQIADHLKDVANYTVELKEIMRELFEAIAAKPKA